MKKEIRFYAQFYDFARSDFEDGCQYVYYLTDVMRMGGATEEADAIEKTMDNTVTEAVGSAS